MRWINIIALILFGASCSSGYMKPSEQILFNKVVAASKHDDRKGLSEDDYVRIAEYIAQGKSRWIGLYPILNKAPFLGVVSLQEGLNIAMAYALPNNPYEVLRCVNDENINYICGAPFIEPANDEVNKYFHETNAALIKLESGLRWKEKCILILRRSLTDKSPIVRPEES